MWLENFRNFQSDLFSVTQQACQNNILSLGKQKVQPVRECNPLHKSSPGPSTRSLSTLIQNFNQTSSIQACQSFNFPPPPPLLPLGLLCILGILCILYILYISPLSIRSISLQMLVLLSNSRPALRQAQAVKLKVIRHKVSNKGDLDQLPGSLDGLAVLTGRHASLPATVVDPNCRSILI